jgi:hypothetical protein
MNVPVVGTAPLALTMPMGLAGGDLIRRIGRRWRPLEA